MFELIALMILSQQPMQPCAEGLASYYTVASSSALTASGETLRDELLTCAMLDGEFGHYYLILAENGNTVPVGFEVQSPMTGADHVKAVHLFAEGNPEPSVASIRFSPASGRAKAATRMRLAKTQNIVAVAEMSDGSVYMAKTEVKVTIGGCGG